MNSIEKRIILILIPCLIFVSGIVAAQSSNSICAAAASSLSEEKNKFESQCLDEQDNDKDGLVDCDDSDCTGTIACKDTDKDGVPDVKDSCILIPNGEKKGICVLTDISPRNAEFDAFVAYSRAGEYKECTSDLACAYLQEDFGSPNSLVAKCEKTQKRVCYETDNSIPQECPVMTLPKNGKCVSLMNLLKAERKFNCQQNWPAH